MAQNSGTFATPAGSPQVTMLPRPIFVVPCVLAAAALCLLTVAMPLAIYTTVLALFGLAHVGSELRYVDYRFGNRLRGRLGIAIGISLAAAVLARSAGMSAVIPAALAVTLEITAGAAMTGVCVACMTSHRVVAVLIALALFSGAVAAPFEVLLFLAIAHNLTPLAFLADVLAGPARRRILAALLVPFVIVPVLIASGLPYQAVIWLGLDAPDTTILASGSIDANLGVYVPVSLINSNWALHIFSAAVFAQCMHYAVVIVLLPRLIDAGGPEWRPVIRWPAPPIFLIGLAGAATLLAAVFAADFRIARQIYALVAMIHAWIEIPILLLALDRGRIAGLR